MWEEKGRHCSEKFIRNLVINRDKNRIHSPAILNANIALYFNILKTLVNVNVEEIYGVIPCAYHH